MSDPNYDPWALSSGLPLDGATVTIQDDSLFAFDAAIAAGAVFAKFNFLNEDSGDEREQSFSVGADYKPYDDGYTVAHESGKPRPFSSQSNYGMWIDSALALPGVREAFTGSDPRDIRVWHNTRWVLGSVKKVVKNVATGVEKETTKLIPVEYLGKVEEVEKPTSSASSKTTTAAARAKAAPKKGKPVLSDEERDLLVALAGEHEDHDSFMNAAFDLDWVGDSPAAQTAIMSTELYESAQA